MPLEGHLVLGLKEVLNLPLYKDEFKETFVWYEGFRWYMVGAPLLGKVVVRRRQIRHLDKARKVRMTANSPWIDKRLKEIRDGN